MDLDAIKNRIAKASTIPDSGITPHQIVGWWSGQKDPITFPKDEYYHPAKNVSNELNTVFAGLRTCVLGLVADANALVAEVERLNGVVRQQNDHYGKRDLDDAHIRSLLRLTAETSTFDGVRLVIESRDNAKRERNSLLEERAELRQRIENSANNYLGLRDEREKIAAELDELRTRYARLTESTDTFISALVDERMKREHKALLDELESHRTRDIDASKKLRIIINAMPDNARAVFEHARIDAKMHGVPIVHELVNMVVNARATASIECDRLRDECRKHLARVNELDSQYTGLAESLREMVESNKTLESERDDARKLRDEFRVERDSLRMRLRLAESRLVDPAKVGKLERLVLDMLDTKQTRPLPDVPDDILAAAADIANSAIRCASSPFDMQLAAMAISGFRPGYEWYEVVRSYIERWRSTNSNTERVAANDGAMPIGVGEIGAIVESTSARNAPNVPEDVMLRAASWATIQANTMPCINMSNEARIAASMTEGSAMTRWERCVREFVKLWRDGRAPDEPTTMTAWPDKP